MDPDTGTITWQVTGLTHPSSARQLSNGDILIAERSIPPRVIEITYPSRTIVWSYVMGFICVSGSGCSDYPRDAWRRSNGNTVIAISDSAQGVIEVDQDGKTVYQCTGVIAYSAVPLTQERVLVTNSKVLGGGVLIVSMPTCEVVWNYSFNEFRAEALYLDQGAWFTSRGTVLVADGKNRVVEIDPAIPITSGIVWELDLASGSLPWGVAEAGLAFLND